MDEKQEPGRKYLNKGTLVGKNDNNDGKNRSSNEVSNYYWMLYNPP